MKQESRLLGLIIPDIANPHYPEITKYVEERAHQAGYPVLLCNSCWDTRQEAAYRDLLLERRVSGLIIMPVCDESHRLFQNLGIPVVFLGSRTQMDDPWIRSVHMDNFAAGALAAETLISRGHKRLAYINRNVVNYTADDRCKGFLHAAARNHMEPDYVTVRVSDANTVEGGCRAARELLNAAEPPTGIVAFNDFLALGVMEAAEEKGLSVGRDISIVGFDNILFAALPQIRLTTITPSKQDLAYRAVDLALGKSCLDRELILPPGLLLRESCGNISFTAE